MPRPRGRPREFDENDVLDKAIEVFLSEGFDASSLDNLAAATGLARASIYAAFGDKETLYLRTLERYSNAMKTLFLDALREKGSICEALTAFYLGAIARYFTGTRPLGCLVICTAAASAPGHPSIREALAAILRISEEGFLFAFQEGQRRGEVSKQAELPVLAGMASALLQSIALRARSGESRRRLEGFARNATALLCKS